jgi:endonuclease/exonuclease/phosphatase family metal-dependent hydrolase
MRNLETGNRKRESQYQELWRARATKTLQFFREEVFPYTDILGMQEFWTDPQYRGIFDGDFQQFGYELSVLQRTGSKLDAVVIAVKKDVFEVANSLNVVLCTLSDRVALILWLRHKLTGKSFIVANTHLSFPHSALDKINQLRQMSSLTNAMDEFARSNGIEKEATCMIMGDFNVECTSRVCEHLRSLGYISCFEVSSPLNPRLTPHSMEDVPPSMPRSVRKRVLRFVSHLNHRNEELGVDHIFVRAAKDPSIVPQEESNIHSPQSSQAPIVSEPNAPTSSTMDPSGTETLNANQHSRNASARVFVDNSRVLPLKVPCTEWESNFLVSDHRPVGATLIVAEPKSSYLHSFFHLDDHTDHSSYRSPIQNVLRHNKKFHESESSPITTQKSLYCTTGGTGDTDSASSLSLRSIGTDSSLDVNHNDDALIIPKY